MRSYELILERMDFMFSRFLSFKRYFAGIISAKFLDAEDIEAYGYLDAPVSKDPSLRNQRRYRKSMMPRCWTEESVCLVELLWVLESVGETWRSWRLRKADFTIGQLDSGQLWQHECVCDLLSALYSALKEYLSCLSSVAEAFRGRKDSLRWILEIRGLNGGLDRRRESSCSWRRKFELEQPQFKVKIGFIETLRSLSEQMQA